MSSSDSKAAPAANHDVAAPYFGSAPTGTANWFYLSIALALALAAAPICLGLRIDWDRTLPLLFLPALLLLLKRPAGSSGNQTETAPRATGNPGENWLLLAAGVLCSASAFLAVHPARAIATTAAWALVIGGGIAATRVADNPKGIRLILAGVSIGGVVSLIIVRLKITVATGVPLFGHPRLLGLYMLTALIAALGLAVTLPKEHKRHAIWLYVVAAILCGGMIWSGGRTPLVGLAAGISLWLVLLGTGNRLAFFTRFLGVAAVGLVISILLGHPTPDLGWNFAFGRTVNADSLTELTSNRSAIWAVSLKEFTRDAWLGHGADFYLFQTPRVSGASGSHPHNFIVQWLLDFGISGTVVLLGLLSSRLIRGTSKAASSLNQVSVVGLATCATAALLDGGFYHAVIFMPAAIFAGLCYTTPTGPRLPQFPRALGGAAVVLSTAVLALNGWLFYQLKYAVPASPESAPAKVLRYFPSNLHGLWTWLDAWKKTDPQSAIEWGSWAQTQAVQPELFGIYTARQYLERKDFVAAEAELRKILTYIVPEQQKPIRGMINEVRRQATLANKETAPR